MSQDLWPDEIASPPTLKAPVTILREQGAALAEKTLNLVEGQVIQTPTDYFSSSEFNYAFYIVAPALDYRTKLFTVHHPISLYPLVVKIENQGESHEVDSEQVFLDVLRDLFSKPETIKIIQALKAQSV